ncbi:HD family phosphohydrolase [Roseimarinus sediminis]|uniref:HD family phosphohydrolase n=1 Tax=Roseimarinus sediminis TaxID=1610899 RepID=UPI003D1F03E2
MNKEPKQTTGWSKKVYYAFFMVTTLAIIYVLYPKQATFRYEFQKGQPWGHETMIAPFDFAILKPEAVLEAEKDSLLSNFTPYFNYDETVFEVQMELLESALNKSLNNYPTEIDTLKRRKLITLITSLYKQLYEPGILEMSPEHYERLKPDGALNKVVANVAHKQAVAASYSLKSAYLFLNDTLNTLATNDTLLIGIQNQIDFSTYLVPNLVYDNEFNEGNIREVLQSVSTTRGVVQAGVRIISEGDVVDGDKYLILMSLKKAYEQNRAYGGWMSTIVAGQMLLVLFLFGLLVLYLQSFNRKIFWKKRNFSMILSTILATYVLAVLVHQNDAVSIYLLPVCILPIIIRTFLGARMAVFIHLVTMLLIGFMAPNSFEFVFIQLVAGTVAVISLSRLHRRGHLVITALLLVAVYSLIYYAFEVIKEGSFTEIDWSYFKWFAGNGLLLLIAYPLIYVIEKIFGFISDVTLMELSDTNHPLLRKLAEIAPGTFQHSMQVANLAEEVILRIGGNPMMVRAGALYHDVGKIKSSQFFIENQATGINPHDKLSNKKSVEKIVSHVFDGVALAKKHKIPESIIDFIKMHHGRSVVKYFYLKYKEEHPDEKVNPEDFMYPGPNPTSRETAVVMLADGVEAATRSLPVKNAESIEKLVNQMIDSKVQNHELDDAPITFRDIKEIKKIFIEKLNTIYHIRIQYPEEKQDENKNN